MNSTSKSLIRVLLICYLVVFGTPVAFAFPCMDDMQPAQAMQHEPSVTMAMEADSPRDCCQEMDMDNADMLGMSCDSVCISLNAFVELDDAFALKPILPNIAPTSVASRALSAHTKIDPRPPRHAL